MMYERIYCIILWQIVTHELQTFCNRTTSTTIILYNFPTTNNIDKLTNYKLEIINCCQFSLIVLIQLFSGSKLINYKLRKFMLSRNVVNFFLIILIQYQYYTTL